MVTSLESLAQDPAGASADVVREAVEGATADAMGDPSRRAALAEALGPLLPVHAETIAAALSIPLLAELLRDGRSDLATLVMERHLAAAAWDRIEELRLVTSAPGFHPTALTTTAQVALARAMAFVSSGDARGLLARLPAIAEDGSPSTPRVQEAEALIRAVEDIPVVEGAARRALARVAAERSWRPDAWGRDHGALVSLVRRRSRSESDGYGGPLMQYLTGHAPAEVARIGKRKGGGSGGGRGAASWWAAGSTPISGRAPGRIGTQNLSPDPQAWYQAHANAAASAREIARIRRRAPPAVAAHVDDGSGSAGARPPRAPRAPRPARRQGGRTSTLWVVPALIVLLCLGWAIVQLFSK